MLLWVALMEIDESEVHYILFPWEILAKFLNANEHLNWTIWNMLAYSAHQLLP